MFFDKFRRGCTISLNRVHDILRVREGGETLTLRVDGDAMRIVAGLNEAQRRLRAINGETDETETRAAALYFAGVIFGDAQAERLMAFYRDDAGCVVNICGRYFSERLSKFLERAQKKAK